jgi:hypothetical protein
MKARWGMLRRCCQRGLVAALFTLLVSACYAGSLADAFGPGWESLPDWRGVWYLEGPLLFAGAEHAVVARSSAARLPFDGGVTPGSYFTGAPYKPEYQKIYDERVAKARGQGKADDPVDTCYAPHGMPRLMGAGPGALEFVVTPKETWIIWDFLNQTRRIYTDGRGHPGDDQRWPRTMGHSVGRWDGQTLVVDTVWPMAGIYDRSGAPYSDQLRVTERLSRTDARTITDEMTLEDPVMFTAPWKVTRHFKRSTKKWENVPGSYCNYTDPQPIRAE